MTMNRSEETTQGNQLRFTLPVVGKISGKKMSPLPLSFSPGASDVICAKGKQAKNHSGNVRFRKMVDELSTSYGNIANRSKKSVVVNQIINSIHEANGAFIKFEGGQWYEVGETLAREKVGQSLREKNHGIYRSSTKSKRKMRKELNQRAIDQITAIMTNNASVAAGLDQLSNSLDNYRKQVQEQQDNNLTASPLSSNETDTELELAMTRANSQILASLKSDQWIQNLLHDES